MKRQICTTFFLVFLIAIIVLPMAQSQVVTSNLDVNTESMVTRDMSSLKISAFNHQSGNYGTIQNEVKGSEYLNHQNDIESLAFSPLIPITESGFGTISTQYQPRRILSEKATPVLNPENQVISQRLAEYLEKNGSESSIRVIITLKDQPQIEERLHIKENTYQRIDSYAQSQSTDSLAFLEIADMETQRMRIELKNSALAASSQSQNQLTDHVLNLNGLVHHKYAFLNAIAASLSPDAIETLTTNPLVQSIVLDELQPILLDHSVETIYADDWHSYGYDGSPWDVAVLDTGVDETHPALDTRVIDAQSFVTGVTDPDDVHGHGTHVAGIIASTQSGAPGVAPGASIINAKVGDPGAYDSDVIAGAEWAATGAADDAEIINHSYGVGISKGEFIDAFVDFYDIVWVGAAGNDGPSSGTVTDVGYNMITVGSMDDQNTDSRTDDTISDFSSRGPTWDNRIKPDLVAPGGGIVAPNYDWEGGLLGLNPDYVSKSGTSMASPHVAGAVALLYSYHSLEDTKYYKTLLMHTADDLGSAGPDNTCGWGYVNMASAYSNRDNVLSGTVQQSESVWYRVYLTAGSSYQATLVFERHGVYYPSTNTHSLSVVSDLDLDLYAPDGGLLDSSASGLNNVEQVDIASAPSTGYYRIRVYGWRVDSGVGTESYSLAHDGGLVRIYKPDTTNVSVNGVSVANGATDGSFNRTESFTIVIAVSDIDTVPANLDVQMEVYDPADTYLVTHTMPYNSGVGLWENTWVFGQSAMAGRWHMIVKTSDNTGLQAQDYHFYFWCINEVPEIHMVSLSSNSIRRVNDTLAISADVTDYHDGTDLETYFVTGMPNGTYSFFLMDKDPISEIFYLDITFSESVQLGTWNYTIYVIDNDGGESFSEFEYIEILNHQYLLTILSPEGTPTGDGFYDAGTVAYAALDIDSVPVATGERLAFQSWTGDGSGSDYSQSDAIIMDGAKVVTAFWETEYYLTVTSLHGVTSGSGWYSIGSTATVGVDTNIVAGITGERFVFDNWTGDTSGSDYTESETIIMDGPKTVTALWETEYYLTVISVHRPAWGAGWYSSGSTVYAGIDSDIVAGSTGERFVFQSWTDDASGTNYLETDPIVMDAPKTATTVWQTQYQLVCRTFPSGLSPDPTITPAGEWFDNGTTITLTANAIPGYRFTYWLVDGLDYGEGIFSITLVMEEAHNAAAYYQMSAASTTSPSTTTNADPSQTPPDFTLLLIVMGGAGAAIVLVVIVLMKKKS